MTDEYLKEQQFLQKVNRIYKLKNVYRYNTRNILCHENVATHCFNTALIALILCDKYKVNDSVRLKCIIKALLHDMPETEYNDITHDVKEKLNLSSMLKKYEDAFFIKEFPLYYTLMSQKQPLVDEIVSYADVLSVKQFVDNEILLGNSSDDIKEIKKNVQQRLKKHRQMLQKYCNKKKE